MIQKVQQSEILSLSGVLSQLVQEEQTREKRPVTKDNVDYDDDDDNNNYFYCCCCCCVRDYATYLKNFRLLSTLMGSPSHLTSRFSRMRIPFGLPANDTSTLALSDKESSLSSISESSASWMAMLGHLNTWSKYLKTANILHHTGHKNPQWHPLSSRKYLNSWNNTVKYKLYK